MRTRLHLNDWLVEREHRAAQRRVEREQRRALAAAGIHRVRGSLRASQRASGAGKPVAGTSESMV